MLIQFVAVVDFTLLLSLGPDLTAPLGLETSRLPLLIAAGTVSAALAGLLGGGWLERAHRRHAMVGLLIALGLAEVLAAGAGDWRTLLVARLGAGAAGGLAMALSLVVLSETVPETRRGRAVGALMAANGLAAIAGVPLGLWIARHLGWQAAFWMVAAGAAAAAATAVTLPAGAGLRHLEGSIFAPLAHRNARRALALTFLTAASSFLLNPNLSAFVQHNLGFPREQLSSLYAVAGGVALLSTQLTGRAVDRWGSLAVGAGAAALFTAVVLGVVVGEGRMPVAVGFVLLLSSLQSRNVSVRALATRVPQPQERGRFMSLLSTAQQLGAAAGALGSAGLLDTSADGHLEGMPAVGMLAVGLALGALPLIAIVQGGVGQRDKQ
jgi:predicted MFS family arabinose efflux permease